MASNRFLRDTTQEAEKIVMGSVKNACSALFFPLVHCWRF